MTTAIQANHTYGLAQWLAANARLRDVQERMRIEFNDAEYTTAVRAYHAATQQERGCDDCHWTHQIQDCPAIRKELFR